MYVCSEGRMATQAAKLKCVLCYFQRVAEDRCNLSSVITLRRQVQLLASFFSLPLLPSLSLPLSPSLPLSLSPSPPLTLSLFPPILRKCIGPGFKSIQLKFASYKMLALSSFLLPVRLVLWAKPWFQQEGHVGSNKGLEILKHWVGSPNYDNPPLCVQSYCFTR